MNTSKSMSSHVNGRITNSSPGKNLFVWLTAFSERGGKSTHAIILVQIFQPFQVTRNATSKPATNTPINIIGIHLFRRRSRCCFSEV